ncbi:M43 family zinc metalloprotease [Tenacibaculum soleae]|uniref:zinc-dependent metalloprotease n=1 Tax=Tenacibaculum soleae TaxID=447689 RepID=UPI0026E30AD3|nr:M43 family zinc metalloprotease [Tenacibaculum soleae]MDO6743598.1 M43 family zinc metalloprotease [Tenacibaculum soleae]
MKKINYLIMFFALTSFLGYSQSEHACKASEQNEIYFKKHPESRVEYQKFNLFTKKQAKNKLSKKAAVATYTIPVVFHVYGDIQHGKTVTTDKIKVALQKLNDDFQGLNPDFNTVDSYFNARKSTLNVEFKLAKLDPYGNCTEGVVYYPEKSGYGNGGGYDSQIANDAWDNYKYMNVYIQGDLYADGSSTNSGVAWYPNTSMSNSNTARVVYNGQYLHGNTGDEFASVLTHEFGHFLNLIHTFDGGCTYPNDEVSDTPPEGASTTGTSCAPSTNCEGNYINYENYMGYNGAAYGCYKMFTVGQTNRMLAALQHPARQSLWQSQNLIDTGVNNSGATLSVDNAIVKELISNNGSFNQSATITVTGANFASPSATLSSGTDYSLTLPQGLSATVQTTSYTTANITITGTASNHAIVNNQVTNLTFNSSAMGSNQSLSCASIGLKFKFYDPFEIIYENIVDVSAGTGATWKWFSLPKINGDGAYGAWQYTGTHLKLETYGKKLITSSATKNITLLNNNQLISTNSNFTAPGGYPDQLDLRTPSHTTWDGQTGYIGFSAVHNDEPIHGWMKASITSDGSSMTIYEYAFSTKPNGDIRAGQTIIDNNPTPVNAPSNLTSTTNSSSEIALSWSDNSSNEDGFSIERTTDGGSFSVIATTAANATSYSNTNLTSNTAYSYRVRAFSGNTNSSYSNTTTSTTSAGTGGENYCAISGNNASEYIQNVTIGSFSNTSGADANGYGNHTSQTINLSAGSTTNISLTPGFSGSSYTEHWAIFIDYNKNNTFESSERVIDGLYGTGTISGSFTTNSSVSGTTRMRVIMKYYSSPTDACTVIGDGEAEDYTVSFSGAVNPPTLETPENIGDSGIYSTGFYASWNTVFGATDYEVQLLKNGSWVTEGASTTYYLWIAKQASETNYTFRVRAKNSNENSAWSNQLSISLPITGPTASLESKLLQLSVSPNPATDYITIRSTTYENVSAQLFNIQGKKVGEFTNKNKFSVQHLTKGMYILKMKTKKGITLKKLLIR